MIAMLEDIAMSRPNAIAVESLDERLTYRMLWQAVCRLRSRIDVLEESDSPVAILLPTGAAYVVAVGRTRGRLRPETSTGALDLRTRPPWGSATPAPSVG